MHFGTGRERDERVEKEGTLNFRMPRDSDNVIVNSQVSKNFLLTVTIYFCIPLPPHAGGKFSEGKGCMELCV